MLFDFDRNNPPAYFVSLQKQNPSMRRSSRALSQPFIHASSLQEMLIQQVVSLCLV